jgi:hypothetical protein
MPVGLDNVGTSWAFVGFGAFDPIHVSSSREMAVRKFDDEYLGAVFHSFEGLDRDIPVN